MSSSRSIEQALAKTQRYLLVRFMSTLLLCLLMVELIVGGYLLSTFTDGKDPCLCRRSISVF